jgi:hypothetical protein
MAGRCRHIVGTFESAGRPVLLRLSGDLSPWVAASSSFEATCVRVPVSAGNILVNLKAVLR